MPGKENTRLFLSGIRHQPPGTRFYGKIADVKEENKQTKPRTPPYILGGIVLLLLTLLVLLQSSNYWKEFSVETAGDTLLLYALSSLNFIALVIFGFIFIRNLLKLLRERRALQVGAKIKTRLLIYFCAISLLPLIAMATFSYLFMNRALERWFTNIPETVVRQARDVETQAVNNQKIMLRETAQMLTVTLKNPTQAELDDLLVSGNLSRIEILDQNGEVESFAEKKMPDEQKLEMDKTLAFIHQKDLSAPALSDGEKFDAATAEFADGRTLVIVPDLRNTENVGQIVDNSLLEFDRLKDQQTIVRQIGLTTLGLLTFLLIFASSWTAFYIAKGLTQPIKALAEGADEIAKGNFSHRVDVLAEDELALLVTTFNAMSARLEQNADELLIRRRYIETVLQTLSTGVISFDADNKITTINEAAEQILKLKTADFTGFELDKLVNDENRQILERLLNRAKRVGKASEQTTLQAENTSGNNGANENLPVALTATALPNNNGAVLVIEDLSELIAAQRASAWSEVARRMAHEIKNPLTPIQLSAERIAKKSRLALGTLPFEKENDANGDKEQRAKSKEQINKIIKEGTDTILREVNSLKSMVDEFSRFARLPDARLEAGDLNALIEQTVLLYEDRVSDVHIEKDLAASLPKTLIDDEQLKRVFVNLIDNALEVFDEQQSDKIIFIKTFQDTARDLIVAEVSDNGAGISPSDFQKLFQPYFSTKGRGTGLGLAIVQRIVSEHRGKIKAVNNSPKGAKFIIELPLLS